MEVRIHEFFRHLKNADKLDNFLMIRSKSFDLKKLTEKFEFDTYDFNSSLLYCREKKFPLILLNSKYRIRNTFKFTLKTLSKNFLHK